MKDLLDKFKRRPRSKIYFEIEEACEFISSMGLNVTVRHVRAQIGKGSHTTIAKYIKLWRFHKMTEFQDKLDLDPEDELLNDQTLQEPKEKSSTHKIEKELSQQDKKSEDSIFDGMIEVNLTEQMRALNSSFKNSKEEGIRFYQ